MASREQGEQEGGRSEEQRGSARTLCRSTWKALQLTACMLVVVGEREERNQSVRRLDEPLSERHSLPREDSDKASSYALSVRLRHSQPIAARLEREEAKLLSSSSTLLSVRPVASYATQTTSTTHIVRLCTSRSAGQGPTQLTPAPSLTLPNQQKSPTANETHTQLDRASLLELQTTPAQLPTGWTIYISRSTPPRDFISNPRKHSRTPSPARPPPAAHRADTHSDPPTRPTARKMAQAGDPIASGAPALSDQGGGGGGPDVGAEASGSGSGAQSNGGVGEKQKKKVKVGARASIACKTCRCVSRTVSLDLRALAREAELTLHLRADRKRKVRCSAEWPICRFCTNRKLECVYEGHPAENGGPMCVSILVCTVQQLG